MKIFTFKTYNESTSPDPVDASEEVMHEVKCKGCSRMFSVSEHNDSYLCDECDSEGFWIDPAGGLHSPDEEDDLEDPAAMYEKYHDEFYKR